MKTIWKMVPGLAMALVIAAAAKGLEYLEGLAGLHLICLLYTSDAADE